MKAVLGFILFAVAVALYVPLTILNIPFVLWVERKRRSFLKNLNGYFLDEAVSIDIHGNRSMRALWNSTMRKSNGYRFGREGETISSALGKNQRDGTLSFVGKLLAGLLDLLDKDHCRKSIKNFDILVLRTDRNLSYSEVKEIRESWKKFNCSIPIAVEAQEGERSGFSYIRGERGEIKELSYGGNLSKIPSKDSKGCCGGDCSCGEGDYFIY